MAKAIPLMQNEIMEETDAISGSQIEPDEAGDELSLLRQLTQWRLSAGLSRAQVAERMGVKPPAISRLERNITHATWKTLRRYAAACGVQIALTTRT